MKKKKKRRKRETGHNSEWVEEIYRKANIFFACIEVMIRKGRGYSLLCFIILFNLCAWKKRDNIIKCVGGSQKTPLKSRNYFACFSALLSQHLSLLKWWCFYCHARLKSKTPQFKGLLVGHIKKKKKKYYLVLNDILDEVIVHVEQKFKIMEEFRFVELLNPNLFHA